MGILKNPAYTGKTYAFTFHQGTNQRKSQREWIEIPGATSAIITKEMFQAAQRQLELNYKIAKRSTKRQYLLRGHLYCQKCGRAYCGHVDRVTRYYHCPGKHSIIEPVNPCLNNNWSAEKIDVLVWKEVERALNNPELIITAIKKQCNDVENVGILESDLQKMERQLNPLDQEQKQLLRLAQKEFPDELVEAENKRINKERASLQSQKAELELRIKASREAIVSRTKLETYTQLVRDMLNIKVWIDAQSLEVTGTIPVEEADVVTKSS